jgi:adenylosuccinate lyase
MPYKRNPMRCERACGLARFVASLPANALATASTQWLERTLDDSSNRRLAIAEAFLALDGALDLMANVSAGLVVYPRQIAARLAAEMPFMATEEILVDAVARGADRQDAHEAIRRHSVEAARRVKEEGRPNDLLERLAADPAFRGIDLAGLTDPVRFIGRAPEQVDRFLAEVVTPIRIRHEASLAGEPELRV